MGPNERERPKTGGALAAIPTDMHAFDESIIGLNLVFDGVEGAIFRGGKALFK